MLNLKAMAYRFISRIIDMKNLILLLVLIVPVAVYANVYKWVDENGKVHYGDSPQVSQPAVEMNVDVTTPEASFTEDLLSREEKRERLLQSMEEDRLEKQEKRNKQKAENEKNRQKCNRYRDRMRHYERANALYKLDKDGNRVYMSDSDRASATKNLRVKINKYCK
jgi:Skp family chaperone for outer membrane proteins